jgi:uncharacterized protein involved in outer membrane biogenesis
MRADSGSDRIVTVYRGRTLRSHRFWRRLLLVGATALALFTVAGAFVGPLVLRHVAEQQVGKWLGRKVTIGRLRLNPFALSVTVERFQVLEADASTPFVSVRRLYVNAELASLFRRALIVREIRLESPRVRVERRQAPAGAWRDAAVYNFSDIAAGPLPKFSLNNIRVIDGALVFDDLPLHGHHEITDFALGIPFLSTLLVDVDTFVAPGMSGRVDGTPFAIKGRSKLFKDTVETVVELRLNALDLPRYLAYAPLPLPVTVSSALLTVALDVSFVRPRDEAPRLSLKGKVALRNVSLREREAGAGPLVDLRDLDVTVVDVDITARRFVVDQVLVSGLDLRVLRLPSGKLNLARPLPEAAPSPAAAWRVEKPPQWSVGEIRIEESRVRFRDEALRPPFEASVDGISIAVQHLSNARGAQATIEAALEASPGGKLVEHGRFSLDPLASTGTISVAGIEPGRFAPYYQDRVAFRVARGRLSLGTSYELADGRDHVSLHLREGSVEAQDLALRRPGARSDFLRLPALAVRGVDADLDRRTVSVAEVSTRDGRLGVTRDERGIVDLTTLAGPSPPSTGDNTPAPTFTVNVARVDLEKWGVRFEDRAVNPPAVVAIAPLSLHVTSLSTAAGKNANVDLRFGLNKKGRVVLSGPVSLDPPAADLRVDLRAVEIVPLQSYWRDQVNLIATGGLVSFKGQVQIEMPPDSPGKPRDRLSPEPRLRLAGDLDVASFGAIDAAKKQELFRAKSFHLAGLKLSTPPVSVAVREVALADFGAQLIVFQDGHFNFSDALGKPVPAATRKAALPPSTPPKISVGQVKVERGEVRFTDRSIRPNPSTELTELTGRVAGLSSSAGTHAEVDLHGRLDHAGPLTIAGKVNPLAKDLLVDLRGAVKDFDLTLAGPYAAKYLGYGIRRGKVSLDVEYHVAERKLDAKNRVVVAGLKFGDKVSGPDVLNLPVKLALALLEDRHGVIDVGLPVSGALDDPGFEFWALLGKAVRNRVVEAATSAPFSLIAKAFGGGDELSRVEFPPGLATLDDRARDKLESLAKALRERGELSFEIQGGTDPVRDREGLRRDMFERKLKAQKRAELSQRGATVGVAEDVRFDPNERSRLLTAAYKAETFAKPRNLFGLTKNLPPDEMEKLMLANIEVEDEDLRALAVRRASAVKEALSKLAPAAAGRLVVVSPFMSGGTSVEFKLKTD